MEDDIKIMRLSTGEDVICKYFKVSKDTFIMSDPMVLMIKYKGINSTILMQHWLPVEVIKSNETLMYNKDLLTIIEPKESLAEYYLFLVEKLHKEVDKRKKIEDLDSEASAEASEDFGDIMEALEESQDQTLH